nr:hypothetical protein [Tanacetum cinerariifolium]
VGHYRSIFCPHVCLRRAGAGAGDALGGAAAQRSSSRTGLAVLALPAGAQAAGGFRAPGGTAFCWLAGAGRAGQRLRPHELGQDVF